MRSKKTTTACVFALTALILLIDQWLKIYVKTHFEIGEYKIITSWFWICFVENNGMAFGMEIFSKILLTGFRIFAVIFLIYYLRKLIIKTFDEGFKLRFGFLVCLVLILAGAVGNIIDCTFYGVIWQYAPLFYGKVVDMFFFPLIRDTQGDVLFFKPVFNFADSCITVAVFLILLFYRNDLNASMNILKR